MINIGGRSRNGLAVSGQPEGRVQGKRSVRLKVSRKRGWLSVELQSTTPEGSPLRGFDRAPLGNQVVAGTGEGISPPQTTRQQELEDGRVVHRDQGRMEVSLPRGRP